MMTTEAKMVLHITSVVLPTAESAVRTVTG